MPRPNGVTLQLAAIGGMAVKLDMADARSAAVLFAASQKLERPQVEKPR